MPFRRRSTPLGLSLRDKAVLVGRLLLRQHYEADSVLDIVNVASVATVASPSCQFPISGVTRRRGDLHAVCEAQGEAPCEVCEEARHLQEVEGGG